MQIPIPVGQMAKDSLPEILKEVCPSLDGSDINAIVSGLNPWDSKQIDRDIAARHDVLLASSLQPLANDKFGAIMVFHDKRRYAVARAAINAFLRQVVPNKKLVIVNSTEKPLLVATDISRDVLDEMLVPVMNYVDMFATGLPQLSVDYIYPHWDDDDIYHPYLLLVLARLIKKEQASAVRLSAQIRLNVKSTDDKGAVDSTAFLHKELQGIEKTTLATPQFLRNSGELAVLDNSDYPLTCLHTKVYTGINRTDEATFMASCEGERGVLHLDYPTAAWLGDKLAELGFKVEKISGGE